MYIRTGSGSVSPITGFVWSAESRSWKPRLVALSRGGWRGGSVPSSAKTPAGYAMNGAALPQTANDDDGHGSARQ